MVSGSPAPYSLTPFSSSSSGLLPPQSGQECSWEDPNGTLGAPKIRGFPEKIGLWVQAPCWTIMSLGMSRVRGRETLPNTHPRAVLKPRPYLWPLTPPLGGTKRDPCPDTT